MGQPDGNTFSELPHQPEPALQAIPVLETLALGGSF